MVGGTGGVGDQPGSRAALGVAEVQVGVILPVDAGSGVGPLPPRSAWSTSLQPLLSWPAMLSSYELRAVWGVRALCGCPKADRIVTDLNVFRSLLHLLLFLLLLLEDFLDKGRLQSVLELAAEVHCQLVQVLMGRGEKREDRSHK